MNCKDLSGDCSTVSSFINLLDMDTAYEQDVTHNLTLPDANLTMFYDFYGRNAQKISICYYKI